MLKLVTGKITIMKYFQFICMQYKWISLQYMAIFKWLSMENDAFWQQKDSYGLYQ